MTQIPDSLHSREGASQAEAQTQCVAPTSEQDEYGRLGTLSMEVSIALTRRETLRDMLSACTDALVRHLGAAFARIWLFNEAEGVLELQASSGIYTHLDGGHARVPLGALKIGYIAAERIPHLTNSVFDDPRVSDQAWARREGMVAFAGYPLLVKEQLIGVMAMFARQPLSDATLQAMETIANGIALGVERLHMQEERVRLLERELGAHREAEAARQRLHDVLMQAPATICILRGPTHVFELANPGYLKLVGRSEVELLGQPFREVLPTGWMTANALRVDKGSEAPIAEANVGAILDQVYTTGEPFIVKESRLVFDRSSTGVFEEGYFTMVYQPMRNAAGSIDGILVHASDVTEQVQARETLQRSQERLRFAQQAGRIGTFELHVPTTRLLWTPELEILYGLPPGGFEGDYKNWTKRIHPEDLPYIENQLREAVAEHSPYSIEFRAVLPDSTVRWMLMKGEVSYDAEGKPLRLVGINVDITERKEVDEALSAMYQHVQELNTTLEVRVANRTEDLDQLNAELQRSNQELQDFAYVASHDLQEPLRKIQAFGNLLEEEYGQALEGSGKVYLDRMRNAAARMRTLIHDLLAFSRVTTKAEPFISVDLTEVVRQVVDDLEPRLQAAQGSIEVGALPIIEADARQMYQLFQNLLVNALKFSRPGIAPEVKVFAEMQTTTSVVSMSAEAESDVEASLAVTGQEYRFFVKDNGIGFDEKYLDRIFTVFQRLHGRDEYEGTGIGLAVVRKIVERHGGTVTAQSVVGEGTTFIITLPVVQ